MNKALVFAAIAVAVISKVIVLKSILIDSPVYQRCVSDGSSSVAEACGIDPFVYFIVNSSLSRFLASEHPIRRDDPVTMTIFLADRSIVGRSPQLPYALLYFLLASMQIRRRLLTAILL